MLMPSPAAPTSFSRGSSIWCSYPPADPSATPTPGNPYANQVTGVAGLFPENILQSGSTLVLDLDSTPGPGAEPARAADPVDLDVRQ